MKTLGRLLLAIPKLLWRCLTLLRTALGNLILLAVLIALFIAFRETDKALPVIETGPLFVTLNAPLVDHVPPSDELNDLLKTTLQGEQNTPLAVPDLVKALAFAKDDPKVTGLILKLDALPDTPLTQLQILGQAITDFKTSQKPVFVMGDRYTQSQYYLASLADSVWLAPDGLVMLNGYRIYGFYYQELLEKLKITPHVFRVGTYKSAVEPYLQNAMSPEAKTANQNLVDQLWLEYRQSVAKHRNVPAETFSPDSDTLLNGLQSTQGDPALLAKNWRWVDELLPLPEQESRLLTAFQQTSDKLEGIDLRHYLSLLPPENKKDTDTVRIIPVNGAIMEGKNNGSIAGSDTIVKQILQARLDDKVKGVILRINSPGGSVFASERIRTELEALKKTQKPLVVSMGSMAASGGYWIATPADKILAQPTTLTGSIGIFAVFPTAEKALNQWGIHSDGVGTTPLSEISLARELPSTLSKMFQLTVDHGYRQFTDLVKTSRHLTAEEIDKVAQGRVWTGKEALTLKLVDQLGDLQEAIKLTKQLAQTPNATVSWATASTPPLGKWLKHWQIETLQSAILTPLGLSLEESKEASMPFTTLTTWQDPKGQYAFCLTCQAQ